MWALVQTTGFIDTHASLSNSCDASFTNMCEKGTELRTRNTFMRAVHEDGLYYNHENQFWPYLLFVENVKTLRFHILHLILV